MGNGRQKVATREVRMSVRSQNECRRIEPARTMAAKLDGNFGQGWTPVGSSLWALTTLVRVMSKPVAT